MEKFAYTLANYSEIKSGWVSTSVLPTTFNRLIAGTIFTDEGVLLMLIDS